MEEIKAEIKCTAPNVLVDHFAILKTLKKKKNHDIKFSKNTWMTKDQMENQPWTCHLPLNRYDPFCRKKWGKKLLKNREKKDDSRSIYCLLIEYKESKSIKLPIV